MSEERDIEVIDDEDGGITVIMRGKAAEVYQQAAARKGVSVEALADEVLRAAIDRGEL